MLWLNPFQHGSIRWSFKDLRNIMLYEYTNGNSATEASRSIYSAFGKSASMKKLADEGLQNSEVEIWALKMKMELGLRLSSMIRVLRQHMRNSGSPKLIGLLRISTGWLLITQGHTPEKKMLIHVAWLRSRTLDRGFYSLIGRRVVFVGRIFHFTLFQSSFRWGENVGPLAEPAELHHFKTKALRRRTVTSNV